MGAFVVVGFFWRVAKKSAGREIRGVLLFIDHFVSVYVEPLIPISHTHT